MTTGADDGNRPDGAGPRVRPRDLAFFFAAYVAGAGFAQWLAIIPGTGISIWPPGGLLLGVLLLAAPRQWPCWLAVALAAELLANLLWFGNPWPVACLLNAGNALHAVAGAWLVRRFGVPRGRLASLPDVLVLVLFGALAGSLASATIGAATLAWWEQQPFARAWILWWVGDATGVLLFAPAVLVAYRARAEGGWIPRARLPEAGLATLALGASCVLGLGGYLPLAYLVTPPLLWAAVRFEIAGAVVASLVIAVATAAYTIQGVSPFFGDPASQAQKHVMLQLFLAIATLSALVVAAITRQRREALAHLHAANETLERRVAERTAALAESEARFRVMADGLPLMVSVRDSQGRLVFVNRTLCEFFGVTGAMAEAGGWDLPVHPEDARDHARALRDGLRAAAAFHAESRMRRADGQWRWIETWARPRFGDDGAFLGHVGSGVDITERKAAEEAVQRTTRALQETDRRKDEFLAMLGHELRNPLAPILNCAALLETAADPVQRREIARMMSRQVAHIARLVDDLLDVSRIAQGKIVLSLAPVDVADWVDRALELSRPALQARGHVLRTQVPRPGSCWVRGDATRLAQVLANVLDNAAKYTPDGGSIRVEAGADLDAVRVEVTDDGKGIAPDLLPHVFDLFVQGGSPGAATPGGLGIGLSLVKRLVELHGGRVAARSEGENRGTTVTLVLPLATPPAGSPARAADRPARRRILLVDDNRDAAESLEILLAADGHDVRCASTGAEAIRVARDLAPEVALLDIGLPDMDGYDLARALRREPAAARALMIATTGYGRAQDRDRATQAGFDHHLVKPIAYERLVALLAEEAPARPSGTGGSGPTATPDP